MAKQKPTEYTTVTYDEVRHITDNAIKLDIAGDDYWVPQSVVRNIKDVIEEPWNKAGEAEIAVWFAKRVGLI